MTREGTGVRISMGWYNRGKLLHDTLYIYLSDLKSEKSPGIKNSERDRVGTTIPSPRVTTVRESTVNEAAVLWVWATIHRAQDAPTESQFRLEVRTCVTIDPCYDSIKKNC